LRSQGKASFDFTWRANSRILGGETTHARVLILKFARVRYRLKSEFQNQKDTL